VIVCPSFDLPLGAIRTLLGMWPSPRFNPEHRPTNRGGSKLGPIDGNGDQTAARYTRRPADKLRIEKQAQISALSACKYQLL
jgi:hypothetical protein